MNALTIPIVISVISAVAVTITMGIVVLSPMNVNTIMLKVKFLACTVIAFFISICFFAYFDRKQSNNINPGEIYIRIHKTTSDNPFAKKTPTDTIRIIEVKDGYALYLSGKDTLSAKKSFIYNTSKRIK